MHLLLNSLSLRGLSPRDLGSPGNHQLLLPQLSSPNLLNSGPLLTILHGLIVELSSLLGMFPFVLLWSWMLASLFMPCSMPGWVVDVWFTNRRKVKSLLFRAAFRRKNDFSPSWSLKPFKHLVFLWSGAFFFMLDRKLWSFRFSAVAALRSV